jgi:hypothetical protein
LRDRNALPGSNPVTIRYDRVTKRYKRNMIDAEAIRKKQTLFQRPDRIHDPLYVVTTVFNATRWRSRWRLYEDFVKHVAEAGAILYTVEIAFGDRDFAVTSADNPRHIQLRTESEIWFKENAINVGVSRLPADWKYAAWVDADVHFARADWANETLHQLQHFDFVQMWSQYQDLTPNHELIGTAHSFAHNYLNNSCDKPDSLPPSCKYYYPGTARGKKRGYPGAPGLSWAATRKGWNTVGGLLDVCILGACDWYMAHGLVGRLSDIIRREYHPRYQEIMRQWEANALYQLTDRSIELRDGLRRYFRERNEDAI